MLNLASQARFRCMNLCSTSCCCCRQEEASGPAGKEAGVEGASQRHSLGATTSTSAFGFSSRSVPSRACGRCSTFSSIARPVSHLSGVSSPTASVRSFTSGSGACTQCTILVDPEGRPTLDADIAEGSYAGKRDVSKPPLEPNAVTGVTGARLVGGEEEGTARRFSGNSTSSGMQQRSYRFYLTTCAPKQLEGRLKGQLTQNQPRPQPQAPGCSHNHGRRHSKRAPHLHALRSQTAFGSTGHAHRQRRARRRSTRARISKAEENNRTLILVMLPLLFVVCRSFVPRCRDFRRCGGAQE